MAISSEVGIYNLALNAVGERSNISLPSENSRRAEVCRLWYEIVRDHVLEAAAWPEATRDNYLSLIPVDADNPQRRFANTYALPADLLRPQYLSGFAQFSLSERDNERLLHTNAPQAILTYTARQDNISLWSTSLRMAIAYGLAAHICMPLSGKPSRASMLADRANELILGARVNAANSSMDRYESVPEWITARGYGSGPSTQYFYPTGNLLTVPNVH